MRSRREKIFLDLNRSAIPKSLVNANGIVEVYVFVAEAAAGRPAGSVRLLAVSKTFPVANHFSSILVPFSFAFSDFPLYYIVVNRNTHNTERRPNMSYGSYTVPNESETVLSGLTLLNDSMFVSSGGTALETTVDNDAYVCVDQSQWVQIGNGVGMEWTVIA